MWIPLDILLTFNIGLYQLYYKIQQVKEDAEETAHFNDESIDIKPKKKKDKHKKEQNSILDNSKTA